MESRSKTTTPSSENGRESETDFVKSTQINLESFVQESTKCKKERSRVLLSEESPLNIVMVGKREKKEVKLKVSGPGTRGLKIEKQWDRTGRR